MGEIQYLRRVTKIIISLSHSIILLYDWFHTNPDSPGDQRELPEILIFHALYPAEKREYLHPSLPIKIPKYTLIQLT